MNKEQVMRLIPRPAPWALALLVATAFGGNTSTPVRAQEIPPGVPLDCGPLHILVGDLVSINVGNVGRTHQGPAVVQLRVLDAAGAPLLDRSVSLALGQSRSARVRLTQEGLVRGEVVPVSGPDDLQLKGTMQVFHGSGDLTYGPNVECSGPTANRGPV
jgi:hypothetical protein